MERKVILAGLDGFSPRIFKYLCSEGKMPFLESLSESGSSGVLRSIVPFETSPAWSSLQTGCRPEKTSIYTFHRYQSDKRQIRLNSFRDIKVPSLWELLSNAGKRVISINMPVTSPPPEVNGIIIPGLLSPQLSRESVHPPEVYDKYIAGNEDYKIVDKRWDGNIDLFAERAKRLINARLSLAKEILSSEDFDLASVQFQMTDVLQHKLWWAIDPEEPGFDKAAFNKIAEIYSACDNALKELFSFAASGDLKLAVSDHGFCAHNKTISINTWLHQNGFLKLLDSEKKSGLISDELKDKHPLLKKMAGIYGEAKKKAVSAGSKPDTRLFCEKHLEHLRKMIDFQQPNIFCLGAMGAYFYVTDASQKSRLAKIRESLLEAYGPESQNPVISKIEIPENESLSEPAMKAELIEGALNAVTPSRDENSAVISSPDNSGLSGGTHSIEGFWAASGVQIKQQNKDAEIIDIAPTILGFLGAEIPGHTDGKFLSDIFSEDIEPKYGRSDSQGKESVDYSDDQQSGVEDQLRDLGYI
ncbi:alkaline phosphatase family protein [Sedimentisphaera salicampi]|uniref:Phosphonoacetate hydrolase n=1 Tax=Sedimentisphaera salicampi TaxID=1941349 RepID=A0A1W6LMY6_9BACT|nr:alkaline phosphatase family protein [Sedimentisphaera salicampi]ARN57111.1 phosphonoacetate hydrolase [Sedimentisphaera salicampi]